MKRPNYNFEPKKPNRSSPVEGVTELCGYSWDRTFEIRAPYEGIDKHSNVLPIIFAKLEAVHPDLTISLPLLTSDDFQEKLQGAIDDAKELVDTYAADNLIDSTNKKSIKEMANLAQDYLNKAKNLQKYWNQYNPHPGVGPTGWPLQNVGFGHGCDGKVHPAEGAFYTLTEGGPGAVAFGCPTQKSTDDHDHDREMFRRLLEAALLNARCAQEGAAFVGTYNRNRKSEKGAAGVRYSPASPQAAPRQTKRKRGEGSGRGSTEGAGDEAVVSTTSTKKKKDNTLLFVGAAALGILALKK